VVLCGVRDVRDYRLRINAGKEVGALYRQHTEETGQPFEPEAVERSFPGN
jgi:hypothetical protein